MSLDFFFSRLNPSSHALAPGSTQPLTEMSARNLPEVKRDRRVGLRVLPPSVSRLSTLTTPQASTACFRDSRNHVFRNARRNCRAATLHCAWREIWPDCTRRTRVRFQSARQTLPSTANARFFSRVHQRRIKSTGEPTCRPEEE
jgi:hypothetical protein